MTEQDIQRKLEAMKQQVEPGLNHQEEMRKVILARLGEMGCVPGEQLYDRGGGIEDSVVYRVVYRDPSDPEAEPIDAAAKITTNAGLGSILDPNTSQYKQLKEREFQTWRQVDHPNIPKYIASQSFPFGFGNLDILLNYFIDAPTVRERIKRKEPISEREAGVILGGLLPAFNHVHTELDVPVVVRDVHPGNILLNSGVYITDFNVVRPVLGKKTNTTYVGNAGYLPKDAIGEDPMPHHDLASLGNVIIAGSLAKEIEDIRSEQGIWGFDNVDLRIVPYSEKLQEYLGKLTASPEQRFQTAREALEGLERVIGGSLSEQVQEPSKEVAEVGEEGNLPSKYRFRETGTDLIIYFPTKNGKDAIQVEKGKDVYGTIDNIREGYKSTLMELLHKKLLPTRLISGSINQEVDEITHAYLLQHAAPNHPIIEDALAGRRSLEGEVLGVRKIKDKNERNEKADEIAKILPGDNIFSLADYYNFTSDGFTATIAKTMGFPIGYSVTIYERKVRKPKQAREMDGWIHQARRAVGGLEEKAEGEVEKPEMHTRHRLRIHDSYKKNLKKILKEAGLRRKGFGKFAADNVEVTYQRNFVHGSEPGPTNEFNIWINTISPDGQDIETAQRIYAQIKERLGAETDATIIGWNEET